MTKGKTSGKNSPVFLWNWTGKRFFIFDISTHVKRDQLTAPTLSSFRETKEINRRTLSRKHLFTTPHPSNWSLKKGLRFNYRKQYIRNFRLSLFIRRETRKVSRDPSKSWEGRNNRKERERGRKNERIAGACSPDFLIAEINRGR